MIPVRFTVQRFDWRGLRQRVLDRLDREARELAEESVRDMCSKMRAGLDPDGEPQKPNPPGVAAAKRGLPPLVKTGRLSDPSAYRVVPGGSPLTYEVLPPADREEAIRELRERDYRTFAIGIGMQKRAAARVDDAVRELRFEAKALKGAAR